VKTADESIRWSCERVGDLAACWPPAAAKAIQRVLRHIVTALHRDFLDRVRHVLDRDLDETVATCSALRPSPIAFAMRRKRRAPHRRRAACPGWIRISWGRNRDELPTSHWRRSRRAARRGDSISAPIGAGRIRTRRETARHRNAGSSRRRRTVWISIIGARMRTPATSVSNARSYSPAKCDTSVEVRHVKR